MNQISSNKLRQVVLIWMLALSPVSIGFAAPETPVMDLAARSASYVNLPAQQKQQLREKYEQLAAEDEPPFPVDGMQKISNEIVKISKRVPLLGNLHAIVLVDAQGKASNVSFMEMPAAVVSGQVSAEKLTQIFAVALINIEYKPGLCSGRPCEMPFPVDVEFSRTPH